MWKAEGSARDLGHLSAPASPGLSAEGRGCSPRPLAVSLLGVGVTGGLLHTLRGLSREGEFGLFWALPGLGAPDSHGHCQRLPLGDSPFESSKLSALSGQRPGPEGVLEPRTRWGNLGLADACATPLLSVRPWTNHYILSPSRAGQTGVKGDTGARNPGSQCLCHSRPLSSLQVAWRSVLSLLVSRGLYLGPKTRD